MDVIHKIGAVIINERRILVGRKKGKFIIPGGRIEKGEGSEECLKRELMEEFGVKLISAKYFGTFEDEAALDPGKKVKIETYMVDVEGKPVAGNEIEEMMYVSSDNNIALGSVLEKFVIPNLVRIGLID